MKIKATCFAAAAFALLAPSAFAQQTTTLLMTTMSPDGSANATKFNDIAARLTAASNGTLRVEPRAGTTLANFVNIYTRVVDDVVQIGWALIPFLKGQFPLAELGGQPGLSNDAEIGSVALWRLYKSGMVDAEFKEVMPISMMVHMPYQLHTAKALASPIDLAGTKMVVGSASDTAVTKALNGVALSLDSKDIYEAVQRGTAGGAIISWAAFGPYKLQEVTTYHVEGPFGTTSSMLFMSRKKYDSLPAAAKQAIDTVGGEPLSRDFGRYLKQQTLSLRDPIAKAQGHTLKALSDAEIQALGPKLEPILEEWAREQPGRAEVVKKYRALYSEIRAGS